MRRRKILFKRFNGRFTSLKSLFFLYIPYTYIQLPKQEEKIRFQYTYHPDFNISNNNNNIKRQMSIKIAYITNPKRTFQCISYKKNIV